MSGAADEASGESTIATLWHDDTDISAARCSSDGGDPHTLCPRDEGALLGSQREAQRELRVLAILALAREAHLAPLISRCARSCVTRSYLVWCFSARMARSARVDLIAELQCCFARGRYKILAR